MLDIPESIKSLFKSDNTTNDTRRHLKLYFYNKDVPLSPSGELLPIDQEPCYVIDNKQVLTEALTITESLCESDDLKFGECNAAQFEITVADVLIDLSGKEFIFTIEVGGYEMAMGIYRVESFVRLESDRRKKKITAYNRMRRFQTDVTAWYQGLNFPMTLKSLRDSLCGHIGIEQVDTSLPLDNMLISKTIEPEQLSGLKVLQAICEVNGCFGQIDKTGRVKYVSLENASLFPSEDLFPEDNLFPSQMSQGETLSFYKQSETSYEDYTVRPIDKVQIRQEEGDIGGWSHEEGTNCYVVQGNFLAYGKSSEELDRIADVIYDQISGRLYRPCKIVGPALPWVEVGDGIICYTTDDVIETYCLKRTLKGIQGMMDTYEARGSLELEENTGIRSEIVQLEGKAAVIKKSVEEVSVKVTDLKEYAEAQFKVTSNEISAEVKRAQEAESSLSVKANEIALRVSEKVSRGEVTSELNSELKITGHRIELTTGNFIITAKNFTVDESGNSVFSGNISGASFIGGNINIGNGKFKVNSSGIVEASDAVIRAAAFNSTGIIYAEKGIECNGEIEAGTGSFGGVNARGIYCTGTVYGKDWQYISDGRCKENIQKISPEECYEIVSRLQPVAYKLIDCDIHGVGFIAQDVKTVLRELHLDYALVGYYEKEDIYTLPYGNYIAILAGAIQYINLRKDEWTWKNAKN